MKKKGFYLLICCLFGLLYSTPVSALMVKAGVGFRTIQQAIEHARVGDTVLVQAGVYHEGNINITRRITLRGIGYPVLDGDHKWEVISVRADSVTIEGFKIINCGYSSINDIAGIRLYEVRGAVIRNNILDNNCFGIYSQLGTSCTIEGNRITAHGREEILSGNGIHCWKSDDMRIIGNDIADIAMV